MDNESENNSLTNSTPVFSGWRGNFVGYATIILVILAVACIAIMLNYDWAHWNDKLGAKLALLLAGLAPPGYLWFEFNVIWKNAPNDQRPPLEEFIHSQEIARDLWIAFAGLITLLYFQN